MLKFKWIKTVRSAVRFDKLVFLVGFDTLWFYSIFFPTLPDSKYERGTAEPKGKLGEYYPLTVNQPHNMINTFFSHSGNVARNDQIAQYLTTVSDTCSPCLL